MKKYFAEMVGTFVLVLMGCGAAIYMGCGDTGGKLAVAFAFGLSVVAMAYCIGNLSGCHINPAITFGAWLCHRISGKDAWFYVLFQVIGAIVASAVLFALTKGSHDLTGANAIQPGFVAWQAFVAEFVFTCVFVLVVLGATDSEKGAGNFAGLAIGLTLVLVHIVCIPITGTSVNPARSIGPALFACGEPLKQLWLFIVAPLCGAACSALIWKGIGGCSCCKK